MTNIHDPLVVVVPCLSAAPAVLSLGCSNQSLLTATNLNTNSRAKADQSSTHDDDDDNCSIFGAWSQAAKPLELVMELAPGPGVR